MHAVKGGWVGQTFALAKSNESEGRKSRIRRSKEERKTMVESFIKKYQKLNNGSFPSLNITHKEVGGSFYTVREIVRDIIQENRVLGTAMLILEDQNSSQLLEQYPVGAIALTPQYPWIKLSHESQPVMNHQQSTNEEPVLVSDVHHTRDEHLMFDNELVINGTQVDLEKIKTDEAKHTGCVGTEAVNSQQNANKGSGKEPVLTSNDIFTIPEYEIVNHKVTVDDIQGVVENKISDGLREAKLHINQPPEAENVEEVTASRDKATPMVADVIVETFPLRPIMRTGDSLDGRLEVRVMTSASKEQETREVELANKAGSYRADKKDSSYNSGLVDVEEVEILPDANLETKFGLVDGTAEQKHEDLLLEVSNGCIPNDRNVPNKIQGYADLPAQVPYVKKAMEQSQESAALTAKPNSTNTKYTDSRSGTTGQSKAKKEFVTGNEVDGQQSGISQKGIIPPLDRSKLESWEGSSKNSTKPDSNPLLDIFKSFIAAFVKFWSE